MTPHGGQDAGVPLIAVNGIELYYESHGTGATGTPGARS
jgi:hypothetical protein